VEKNILLIQGPMGTFFNEYAKYRKAKGSRVFKINLNLCDKLFYNQGNETDYTGKKEDFSSFLLDYVIAHGIDSIYIFGDCRSYHKDAKKVSAESKIDFYVFELGYVRPDYITLEKDGVNANSSISKDPDFYKDLPNEEPPLPTPAHNSYPKMAFFAAIYYFVNSLVIFNKFKENYQHHKDPRYLREAFIGIRSFYRKTKFKITEKNRRRVVYRREYKSYFVVPIQVSTDFQIIDHSPYKSVASFVEDVISSFSEHSDPEEMLVIKHHPMDRGVANYEKLINRLSIKNFISDRVIYVHDMDLPTILKHAKGVVVVNSTVGLSALYHKTPVKTMGDANYDIPGICYQGALKDFWKNPGEVDEELFEKYRFHLIEKTQVNGSFYGLFPKFVA
jgi:capsular polysaccharide export protein